MKRWARVVLTTVRRFVLLDIAGAMVMTGVIAVELWFSIGVVVAFKLGGTLSAEVVYGTFFALIGVVLSWVLVRAALRGVRNAWKLRI